MSEETTSKPLSHHMSKRTRAPPPPTKKPSFEEGKNGALSDQEKDTLKKNGSTEDIGSAIPGPDERQFTVVLPGEKIIKASAVKDTPVLDLLIKIAAKNHLSPTAHMIAQPAARSKDPPIQLKPNQKLSDVVGDTIYIIPRTQKQLFVYKKDFKKSAVYEPTTRITVISSKNRKICLRVDPEKTLEELLPKICEERGVEQASHALRLIDQPQEPLDMSHTLDKVGVVEFLLLDLKAPPAGGFEFEAVTEQKKKKGSFFGRMTKKKKGYELGGMGSIEEPTKSAPAVREDLTRRNTAPHLSPPTKSSATTQEPEESNTNSLKKRRPAPPPPMGKRVTASSDEDKGERTDEDSNTLKKRRAPAPPRPCSPPRRTKSLGASAAHTVPSFPPPRPTSPPTRSPTVPHGEKEPGDAQLVTSPSQEEMEEQMKEEQPTELPQDASGLEAEVATLSLAAAVEGEEQEAGPERSEGEENGKEVLEEEADAVAMPTEEPDQDKDSKAQRELLSHMMKMSLDEDAKDAHKYPPHTQADDAHDMLEEKSVHALAFEVTREATPVPQDSPKEEAEEEGLKEEATKSPLTDAQESPEKAAEDSTTIETPVEEEAKTVERPNTVEAEAKGSPSSGGGDRAAEQLTEQYTTLQAQLAALQKQMQSPQQPGLMEMQMQQLQQQMLLQQQLINQMVMASNQQPVVLPLPYQQSMLSPQQQMMSPQQQMMSPQQQIMSPQQQMLSPQQQMLAQQQLISPQQQMLSPQQQMVVSPQQLLMTPPMIYPTVSKLPNTSLSDSYSQQATATATATVQAQQTPIPSTLDLSESMESPAKESDISKSDGDSSLTEPEAERKRPLSPALKADEVSVSHPTYHFVRSREVPNKDTKAVHASPPNTLRSPKQHQRASILDEVPSLEGSPKPAQKEAQIPDSNKNAPEGESNAEKLPKPEPSQDGGGVAVIVDANQNQTVEKNQTEDPKEKTETKTVDKNGMAGETASISAFAVSDSNQAGPASTNEAKSPKQKKSGFSLFKKKTPKYSYILSAQREFSRKSETERQQKSPPNAPNDAKATDSGKTGRDLWPR